MIRNRIHKGGRELVGALVIVRAILAPLGVS